MALSLSKGGNLSLSKEAPGMTKVLVGLGWDARSTDGQDFDLDASAFLLKADGKVRADSDFIFYNQLKSVDGSVEHTGDNRTGEGDGDDETISVDLTRLPANVETLVLTVTSFRGQTFDKVANAFGRVIDLSTNRELARYDISESGSYTGLILASLKRSGGEWVYKAIGERAAGVHVQQLVDQSRRLI